MKLLIFFVIFVSLSFLTASFQMLYLGYRPIDFLNDINTYWTLTIVIFAISVILAMAGRTFLIIVGLAIFITSFLMYLDGADFESIAFFGYSGIILMAES